MIVKRVQKYLVVDYQKCTGCRLCALACSLEKTGTCNPARARIRVADWEEKGFIVPIVCQDCAEPICMNACKEKAIIRDVETGAITIDRSRCTNCKICMQVCPFGGPSFDPAAREVVLCDHCSGNPACTDVCTRGALRYTAVDDEEQRTLRLNNMAEMRLTFFKLSRSQEH